MATQERADRETRWREDLREQIAARGLPPEEQERTVTALRDELRATCPTLAAWLDAHPRPPTIVPLHGITKGSSGIASAHGLHHWDHAESTGTILIDIDQPDQLHSLVHELAHFVQKSAKSIYVDDAIRVAFAKGGGSKLCEQGRKNAHEFWAEGCFLPYFIAPEELEAGDPVAFELAKKVLRAVGIEA